jgi:hypothetical protein
MNRLTKNSLKSLPDRNQKERRRVFGVKPTVTFYGKGRYSSTFWDFIID